MAAQAPPPPSPPPRPVPPVVHLEQGWRFEVLADPMWPSDRIDVFEKDEQLCKVPDMFCGGSMLRVSHEVSGFELQLDAAEALRGCRWRPPPAAEATLPPREAGAGGEAAEGPFFGAVRCQFADRWKPKSDNPDVKELEVGSDWTCSTPYWGASSRAAAAEPTEEGLPMELLRRRDEILWYNEVLLWEDELDDNGICRASIRVRVMPTFWFALFLCELRVDNVMMREVGTRYFGAFGGDHVLREWTWKEASYQALTARGVRLADNPAISHMSAGTVLLADGDVKRQLRHKLPLAERP